MFLDNTNQKNLKQIIDCSQQILPIMNYSVTLFQEESERKSTVMKMTEFWIFIGTLLTLLLEALFIIRPVLKRYVEVTTALEFVNKEKFKSLSLRMDLAIEAANIGVWEWDCVGDTYIWNERMYELYGIESSQKSNIYALWSNATDPEYIPIVEKNISDAIRTNGVYNAMFWITTSSGERRYIRAIGKGEKDAFGNLNRMVGINIDITDFKMNEDVLNNRVKEETLKRIEQEKILVQQSKLAAMGEMMANLAHQWKQPLMMVSMGVLALQKKYKKGEVDQAYMQDYGMKTNEIISRMSQTIVDFSEYFSPNKAASNFLLADCVQKNVAFLDPLIKSHSIVLTLNISLAAKVTSFENELSQVLLNLLKNSIDAIAEKNIEDGIIDISIIELPKEWMIRVLDNGGGIPEDILHRIFEPYFTTKFKSNGTGIGLYMSKMITEQSLHGSLEVINKNTGAQFFLELF